MSEATQDVPAPRSEVAHRYLDAVITFADNVLKHGRDTYGPKQTPLLVDGINVDTLEPPVWRYEGQEWVMSNLASQQDLLRTLVGLSEITGEPMYRQAAVDAVAYAFDSLQYPNGLLPWGGHAFYDALGEKVVGEGPRHELELHYPFYELLWQVNPEATKRFIEASWSAHVIEWERLDINRHGAFEKHLHGDPWNHEYIGGNVPFTGKGLSFIMAGTDLVRAAAWLSHFSGDEKPLIWAKRLAKRYVEARHPETGLGPANFTVVEEHRMEKQFPQFGGRFTEATVTDLYGDRYRNCAICQIRLGEVFGANAQEFLQWAIEDLTARANHGYDEQTNTFAATLIDGTELSPEDIIHPGYVKQRWLEKRKADGWHFLAYALAYRLSKDDLMWRMTRAIGRGLDLGELGKVPGKPGALNHQTRISDPLLIFGLLELYDATGEMTYLELAAKLGDNALESRFDKGFFVQSKKHVFAKFDDPISLALLHLHAALIDLPTRPPEFWAGKPYFHCRYNGKGRTYDNYAIYDQSADSSDGGGVDLPSRRQGTYLKVVKQWADTLLEYGRDDRDSYETRYYGTRKNAVKTPMFFDGLSVDLPHTPTPFYITKSATAALGYPREAIPASFSQNMIIAVAFKELSRLTGDDRYIKSAKDMIRFSLNTGTLNQDGTFTGGLMFADSRMGVWGNHATYDALNDGYVGGRGVREDAAPAGSPDRPMHEMEHNHMDVEFLNQMNPQALKEYLEAYLFASTLSWETLKYTRHLSAEKPYSRWSWELTDRINENQQVPCDEGNSPDYAGYVNMIFAFWHNRLYDEPRAWKVGYQMLKRFMDARDPKTGLGPMSYVTNQHIPGYTEVADYRRHRYSIGVAALLRAADGIFDRPKDARQRRVVLGFALEELRAYGRHKLIPGTATQWGHIKLDGSEAGRPIQVSQKTLWAYAMAYRLADEAQDRQEFWQYIRDIIKGYGLGDIGDVNRANIALNLKNWELIPIYRDSDDPRARLRMNNSNAFIIHALLELYRSTKRREYLASACFVADTLVARLFHNGLFMRQENSVWARTADLLPLALLDLEAAMAGKQLDKNSIQPTFQRLRYKVFDNPHGGGDVNDNDMFFYKTRPAQDAGN